MSTQPQAAVAVAPPLPNRRNAELFLLGFAAVITTVALLIVEANQEQGLSWDLALYTVAYLALFGGAHLARFLDLGFFASIRLERATHEIEIA